MPGDSPAFPAGELGDTVRITIADTGVGIPPEFRDNLFRIDKKTSTAGTDGEPGTSFFCTLPKAG